ncbi:MAG TPA: isoprenylcysteine carboxylmethyltransferase family protein [Candidatus Limnocylindrales bacterium]
MEQPTSSNMPALGRRGGGWVGIQLLLIGALLVAGMRGRGDVDGAMLLLAVTVGTILIAIGAALVFAGIRGLRTSVSPYPKPNEDGYLITDGVYAYVRHPIYLGLILVSFGWACAMDSLPALLVAVIFTVFLDLKSRREEAWLKSQYPDYVVYAAHTRRFVPYVY